MGADVNEPRLSAAMTSETPVDWLVMVTLAAGMAAPPWSVTKPVITPVSAWLHTGTVVRSRRTHCRALRIIPPVGSGSTDGAKAGLRGLVLFRLVSRVAIYAQSQNKCKQNLSWREQ